MTASRRLVGSGECIARINSTLARGTNLVPLLVFRLPEFAERAWSEGKRNAQRLERATARAFTSAAARVVRAPDTLAHDPGSDWFCVAMLAPARTEAIYAAIDARSALERIATTMSAETGRRMESGWWHVEEPIGRDRFALARTRALERGARERERYEFLATLGHELRTPLTSIRGYIETLLDEDVDADVSRRFLETARREAMRLTRLVEGILDFSLLDVHAGGGRTDCDVTAIVRASIDALLPIAAEAHVRIDGPTCEPLFGRIDPDACTHVILNLVENAIKYSSRPGIVAVSLRRVDPYLTIAVDDDGRGVADEERSRIFSYGERGTDTGNVNGRGVGLSIVRTIVERAGGAVRVEASPLGGARFSIDLIATKAEAAFSS